MFPKCKWLESFFSATKIKFSVKSVKEKDSDGANVC